MAGINGDRTIKFGARFVAVIGGDSTTTITFVTPASDILLDRLRTGCLKLDNARNCAPFDIRGFCNGRYLHQFRFRAISYTRTKS